MPFGIRTQRWFTGNSPRIREDAPRFHLVAVDQSIPRRELPFNFVQSALPSAFGRRWRKGCFASMPASWPDIEQQVLRSRTSLRLDKVRRARAG